MKEKVTLSRLEKHCIKDIQAKELNIYNSTYEKLEFSISIDSLSRVYVTVREAK